MMRSITSRHGGLLLRVAEASIGQGQDQEGAAHEVPLGVAAAHLRQFPLAGLGVGPQVELLGGQPRGERLDLGCRLGGRQWRPKNEVQAGQPDRRCGNERNHARISRFRSGAMDSGAVTVGSDTL